MLSSFLENNGENKRSRDQDQRKYINLKMSSLDDLLHEAECLERGSKGDSVSSIGIAQMASFFNKFSANDKTTLDGRLLLAQQGIDAAKTEIMLKDMQAELKPAELSTSICAETRTKQKYIPLRAIEQFERLKQQQINTEREFFLSQLDSCLNNEQISQKPLDSEYKLFPTDKTQNGALSEYAQVFANLQTELGSSSFESVDVIIKQSIEALNRIADPSDKSYQVRLDFFKALQSILCSENLDNSNLSNSIDSPEILREMVRGSLRFLTEQFRNIHFPNGDETSMNEIDAYVLSHFPNVQPPWPHIWISIRAGLISLAQQFITKFNKETKEFAKFFKAFVFDESSEPNIDFNLNININSHPSDEFESFKALCYMYTIGQEIQQPPTLVVKNAEDFIFSTLAPLRYSNSNIGSLEDYGTLNEIQTLVVEEATKIFNQGNFKFVCSMLLALILKFDTCADQLLNNKLFPIEVVHILMIFKKCGLWNSPSLPFIINEFVQFLPNSMAPQIVDYLAFAENQKNLIDFLLSLDIRHYSINLESDGKGPKATAAQLISQEIESDVYSIKSLHLLVLCLDYSTAYNVFISMSSNISSFSLPDSSKAILICSILLARLKGINNTEQATLIALQNAGLKISLHSLSRADDLTQSERIDLLENVQRFLSESIINEFSDNFTKDSINFDTVKIDTVKRVSHCLSLLVHFDSGRSDLAVSESRRKGHIIPFDESEINESVEWMNKNMLPSSTIVGATAIRFISFYLDNIQRNKEKITALFDFCRRIQTLSDDTNSKIMTLYDRFVELAK
ncbi:hypothetical protein TRFO_24624 [Tritrichomonas foetus]|uniref:Nuclear pore protein n=1 Tax=Tritrichomonas foetus TaxID=1144522 RepID=A0A1J4KC71_9EUKA|nr:hypothetical protein TRFO_24624 [Tritrichomonas foetus]|eukprot:OHT07284.1 hypothetical protein TRFO_24624 [Tritrichomonas foetus]